MFLNVVVFMVSPDSCEKGSGSGLAKREALCCYCMTPSDIRVITSNARFVSATSAAVSTSSAISTNAETTAMSRQLSLAKAKAFLVRGSLSSFLNAEVGAAVGKFMSISSSLLKTPATPT